MARPDSRTAKVLLDAPEVPIERLYEVMDHFHSWSTHWLGSPTGKKGREHLHEYRGLSAAVVAAEGIGYVPPTRNPSRIVDLGGKVGILPEELVACGLAARNSYEINERFKAANGRWAANDEELTEFFRRHLMDKDTKAYTDKPVFRMEDGSWKSGDYLVLPYFERRQDGGISCASFKARSLAEQSDQRYSKPATSAIYSDRDSLPGLAGAEHSLRAWGQAVMVEGEIDRYVMIDAFREAFGENHPPVLNFGTSSLSGKIQEPPSTPESEEARIQRAGACAPLIGSTIVLIIDDDSTGLRTSLKNVALLASIGCRVHVVRPSRGIPEGVPEEGRANVKDLSDLRRLHGPEAVRYLWGAAHYDDALTLGLDLYRETQTRSPIGERTLLRRWAALDDLLAAAACVAPERLEEALNDIATATDLPPRTIAGEFARRREQAPSPLLPSRSERAHASATPA